MVGRDRGEEKRWGLTIFSPGHQRLISLKWREKSEQNAWTKMSSDPLMFKKCGGFCHFLHLICLFPTIISYTYNFCFCFVPSITSSVLHILFFYFLFFFCVHFFLICYLSFFSSFFPSFVLGSCAIFFFFLFFFFNEVSFYIQFLNKNIMCNFFYLIGA